MVDVNFQRQDQPDLGTEQFMQAALEAYRIKQDAYNQAAQQQQMVGGEVFTPKATAPQVPQGGLIGKDVLDTMKR